VRRPTGGGIVPHDADWTYSLAFPTGHEWYELKAVQSYQRVHEWIQKSFSKLNVPTELAPCCKKSLPGQCFVGHEKSDLLWHGKKIAGAAQRRTRDGLLIQGSVQPPFAQKRMEWQTAMSEVAQAEWGRAGLQFVPDECLIQRVEELIQQKCASVAYNQKR
jgi:lipoate-protein ligase A